MSKYSVEIRRGEYPEGKHTGYLIEAETKDEFIAKILNYMNENSDLYAMPTRKKDSWGDWIYDIFPNSKRWG